MNDNRNMLLAIALSALVLIGWSFLSEMFLPAAGPQISASGKRVMVAARCRSDKDAQSGRRGAFMP